MVNRIATKLTEEEHTQLFDLCNTQGCTPSAWLKEAIMERLKTDSGTKKEFSDDKVRKFLGVKPRYVDIIEK